MSHHRIADSLFPDFPDLDIIINSTAVDLIPLLRHRLLHLWHAKNTPNLGCLIRSRNIPYDRLSVAVKFLGEGHVNTAVEFRMHEGTLDPVLTKLWMNFCVALVKKATRLDKKEFGDLVTGFVARSMGTVQQNSSEGGATPIVSMLRDLDIPGEEIRLWKKKITWWGERPGVGLVLPLPRPWVMDGVISEKVTSKGDLGVGSKSDGKGQDLKGKDENVHMSSEGSFLPRLGDDEHRLY